VADAARAEAAGRSVIAPTPIVCRPGMDRLFGLIEEVAAVLQGKPRLVAAPTQPFRYEVYCKGVLEADGWTARTIALSGAQEGGLVAEIDGMRLVTRCLRQMRSVGTETVKEVIAARTAENADHAAVVSVCNYTAAAHALAKSAGVLLLHHAELPGLASRLMAAPLPTG
jgi:restriction system protein